MLYCGRAHTPTIILGGVFMKRSVTLIAVLLLLVAVLCCGCFDQTDAPAAPLTAKQVLEQATQKTADNYEMNAVVNTKIQMAGITMEIPITMNIKMAKKDGAPVSLIDLKMSMLEQQVDSLVYTEGDTAYIVATVAEETVKYKMPAESAPAIDFDFSDFIDKDGNLNVPEETIKMTENEDGSKTLSFPMPTDLMNSLMESMSSTSGLGQTADVTFKPADATMSINKDGYFTKCSLKIEATMSDPSVGEVSYVMDFDFEYVNPGKAVTVTPPEGYKDFMEMPTSEL